MPKSMSGNDIHDGLSLLMEHDSGIKITTGKDVIYVWPRESDGYLDMNKQDQSAMESIGWVYCRDETNGGSWVYHAK